MQRWEYYSVRFAWYTGKNSVLYRPDGEKLQGDEAHQFVSNLGLDGWELVQIGQHTSGQDQAEVLWFKRPVP
jgi:hypothetical protein